METLKKSKKHFCVISTSVTLLLIIYYSLENNYLFKFSNKIEAFKFHNIRHNTTRPSYNVKGVHVIALVVVGERLQLSILLRYLIPNLKVNGGALDEIIFSLSNNEKADFDYVNSLLKQTGEYSEYLFISTQGLSNIYKEFKDEDLVFRIDGQIVFISNGTFENMLEEYISNKGVVLSANVINHPLLSHVHARIRAILPFIEIKNYKWVYDNTSIETDKTVFLGFRYEPRPCLGNDGKCAAIAHESLFHHVDKNNVDAFDFNKWDFHCVNYSSWSISFILLRSKYAKKICGADDEVSMSISLPMERGRHGYALGSAVVSHFSNRFQEKYLHSTNILDKYDQLSRDYFSINYYETYLRSN